MPRVGVFLCWLLIAGAASAQAQPAEAETDHQTGTLRIVVDNIEEAKGAIAAGLFRGQEAYEAMNNPFSGAKLPLTDTTCTWIVEGLPYGDYAVTLYHDKNNNGELDSNLLRIPKEPYGFSNNARPTFGPPDFEAVKVTVAAPDTTIRIALN